MKNMSASKFLQAVALDLTAAKISEPTMQQIQDAMQTRLDRDYELGCWITGRTEAARTMRSLLGTLVFVDCHNSDLAKKLEVR